MKKLITILLLALCFQFSAFGQEDTTRYFKFPSTYGDQKPRIWATKVLRIPDTSQVSHAPGAFGKNAEGTKTFIWDGTNWNLSGGGGGGGTDELDTTLVLAGDRTSFAFPHGLSYTPASATISLSDSNYGIPEYSLDSTYIYLMYSAAPVGLNNYKISFHTRAAGGGGGGGGGGANNYTTGVAFNNNTFNLTTARNSLTNLVTSLSHNHPQSQITDLADSIISKANKTGTNASGTWPISITGSAAETDPKRLSSAAFSGTTTQTLTLTLADGSTFTPSFAQTAGGVTSFNTRTGAITPASGDYTTTLVPEGTNLYYTDARFNSAFTGKSTTDLSEGTNLYYTAARFNTAFSGKTTSDLTEGTNLYYTDVRSDARADARITVQKGANSGLATLDGSGKVPLAQLPAGAQTYKGTWDANTNTPTLIDGTGTAGDTYNVSVGATRNLGSGNITFIAGDDVIYNGTIWQKNPSASGGVSSVNAQTGVVTLTTSNITEGTNLYYTATRFNTAFSAKSTTDLTEGTNLYSTTARIRAAISVAGDLTYAAGVIGYTAVPFNAIAGTNVTITGTYPNKTFNATNAISTVFTRTGNITAQSGDYTGIQITNTPAGTISATNAQAAINELATEKVAGNIAITAGTNTKITYDTKGLVTSGASLVAADIPSLDIAKITTGNWPVSRGGTGFTALGTALQVIRVNAAGTALEFTTPSSGGSVTTFTAANLSPLFTTSVATPTTTPALGFSLSNAAANTLFGNGTNASALPTYFVPTLSSTLFKNQGTATTILHGNAAGNPSWGQIDLLADVTGVLPIANGGTGIKAFAALTDGATITWNYLTGFNKSLTIGGNRTLAITNDADGDYGTLIITQDGTGNRNITVPAGDKLLDATGTGTTIDLPDAGGAIGIISFVKRGAVRYWTKGYYH